MVLAQPKIYEVLVLSKLPTASSEIDREKFVIHEPLETDLGQALASSRPKLPLRNRKQREESHAAGAS